MARLTIFDPAPRLSIHLRGPSDAPEVHLHAGGQGVWIARMARVLDSTPQLCGCFGGESGTVVHALLEEEGIEAEAVRSDRANGVSVHTGNEGDPETDIARTPDPELERHELDTLYSTVLASALRTSVCVLAGTARQDVLPNDTFRRLTTDLRANDVFVLADLSGHQLEAAAEGGINLVKVSDEELLGRATDDIEPAREAVARLRESGANDVVVSRASKGAYAVIEGNEYLLQGPQLEAVNPRGAGDAMTGALGALASRGVDRLQSVMIAVAAGALNVTRHGMATGESEAIERLAERVTVEPLN